MAILRHSPGEPAPVAGRYALVGHYGEPTNYSIQVAAGERLPSITVAADLGPFWYVRVDEAHEGVRAA